MVGWDEGTSFWGIAALFSFRRVSVVSPDGDVVLRSVDGEIPDSGITVVVGPSGSGKTTLLRLCNRLEAPTEGTVTFRGQDVASLDPLELRRRVGFIFPTPVLLGGTVADELRVARPEATERQLVAALERVELSPTFLSRAGDTLSTGEAQRVCLARSLLTEPQVLLADEPTASLDVGLRAGLERLARRLAGAGTPVVWVTHDLAQARRLADHLIAVIDGGIAAAGPPAVVASEPAVSRFLASDAG